MIDSQTAARKRSVWFVVCQVVILMVGLSTMVYSAARINSRPVMPSLNTKPRVVRPEYNDPRVVSDEQLSVVLRKIHPKFLAQPTKVNFVDHAVRMWGVHAKFDDGALSGRQMLTMLLHHPAFAATWGSDAPALLHADREGIAVTTQEGRSAVSHVDHLLGTLAEIGVPLTQRVTAENGNATVHDIMRYALHNFRLNQREYEWTTLATAFYAANDAPWVTCEGQEISFDVLAERLTRQQQPQGVCYGNHRLYTLVMLLRIDAQMRDAGEPGGLITDRTREEIYSYLTDMTRRLCTHQSPDGYWDGNWSNPSQAVPDPETDATSRRILATGHALEWWAMAPEELHPPRETIIRASQWLVVAIEAMDAHQIEKNYTFLTHAARALALWRGVFPAEFETQVQDSDAIHTLSNDTTSERRSR
jgi:hypothetical protein